MSKKQTRFRKKAILFYCLIGFFALVFLGSGIYVGSYFIRSRQNNSLNKELANMLASAPSEVDVSQLPTAPVTPDTPTDPVTGEPVVTYMQPDYAQFYLMNSDMVGWLRIPGTVINYPVVQPPEEDPDFYLTHNFKREYTQWGAIYADANCNIYTPSDNVVIYGHHMGDGSMFASLMKYEDYNFWKEHPTIQFDTVYGRHTYRIFAVFVTSADPTVGIPYHLFVDAKYGQDFDELVDRAIGESFYSTGIAPRYGQKIISLSTCEYSIPDGRLVVMAVRES